MNFLEHGPRKLFDQVVFSLFVVGYATKLKNLMISTYQVGNISSKFFWSVHNFLSLFIGNNNDNGINTVKLILNEKYRKNR